MKNLNNSNPYSFYVLDEDEVFCSLEEANGIGNEENTNDAVDNNKSSSSNLLNLDVFSHQDNKILQEYCFYDGGSTGLYRKFGDNKLAVLYEEESLKEGSSNIYIYTPTTMYTAIKENNTLTKIVYMTSEDCESVEKFFSKPSQIPIISRIAQPLSTLYSLKHLHIIKFDSKYINTEQNRVLYNDFKNNYIRYNAASKLIPAQCTIEEILNIVNHYIATGKINKDKLLSAYIQLQNFQELCSGTIQDISSFIYDPHSVDLRDISDSLNHKIGNIEKLINMYLSNELER